MKGANQCPKCGSRRFGDVTQAITKFYAGTIRVCANCATAWEPFDPAALLDKDLRYSSFLEPCNNCAFRPGSPEQANTAEWKKTIASLKAGAGFYCHKGVPVTPNEGHGFAYPEHSKTKRHLRPCRGYLNMLPSIWKAHNDTSVEVIPFGLAHAIDPDTDFIDPAASANSWEPV